MIWMSAVLLLTAVAGFSFILWRARVADKQAVAAHRQTVVAEQGLITDRVSKAIENLGDTNVMIRLGGLYALKRITEDSPEREHQDVMDVLSDFIRRTPYADAQRETKEAWEEAWKAEKEKAGSAIGKWFPELNAINCLDIVIAIKILQGGQGYRPTLLRADLSYLQLIDVDLHGLDLTYADLSNAKLREAKLREADLRDADLIGADLLGADLGGAKLYGANLSGADLSRADLSGADLFDANLSEARLREADLSGADLFDANLSEARLRKADLSGADLSGADLSGADLSGADLSRADLFRANLTKADLSEANLTKADLSRADLSGADLSEANLTKADLRDADLSGADLSRANLSGADLSAAENLTQEQLDSACIEKNGILPILPEGLKPPGNICPM